MKVGTEETKNVFPIIYRYLDNMLIKDILIKFCNERYP